MKILFYCLLFQLVFFGSMLSLASAEQSMSHKCERRTCLGCVEFTVGRSRSEIYRNDTSVALLMKALQKKNRLGVATASVYPYSDAECTISHPTLRDFGTPVGSDWTAVVLSAEQSSAKQISLPLGRYQTSINRYQAVNKVYTGPGQLIFSDGKAGAPHRSFVLSPPAREKKRDLSSIFDYDTSAIPLAAYKYLGPNSTSYNKSNNYTNFQELSQSILFLENYAGFNESLKSNSNRSGIFQEYRVLKQAGQGDLVGRSVFGTVESTRAGATHFLSNPNITNQNFSFGVMNGAVGAYLQESEGSYTDGGVSIAVIDRVRGYKRTNGDTSMGQVWIHDRPASNGTVPIDAFYQPLGKASRGLDLSMVDLGTTQRGVAMSPGQKIVFACSVKPIVGIAWGCNEDYGVSIWYDSQTRSLHINAGSGNNIVLDNLPTSAKDLRSGSIYKDSNGYLKVAD